LDVVKEFIKAGADVNAQGGWPLVAAADKGHLAVVQELIKAGADVNGQYGQYKRTPLEFAAYGGHLAVVQELIKNGADVKASGALASAADKGHLDVVKELIKNGADVNGKEGEPLQNAVSGGYLDVVQELIKDGADVNLPTKVGNLQAAAETGNVDIVKALIKAGAKVNAGTKTKPFYTAWAVATGLDNKDIVAELERAGARGSRDQRSYALGYAALKGNLELVKKLLKAGADVNGVGNDSPLGWAIDEEGHLDVVQELIKAGADVNKRFGDPKNNLTPLHIAALFGNMEIAKALVDAGADTLVRTKEGRTPRMTAAQSGHAELAAMFREAEKKQKEAK
jgi:ankyrin repeat protein